MDTLRTIKVLLVTVAFKNRVSMAASLMTWEGAAKISNLFSRMLTTKLIRMSGSGERKLWILEDHQNMTVCMTVG